jgi:hypothetical protein
MARYVPSNEPNEERGLRAWIAGELRRVAAAFAEQDTVQLAVRGVEPSRPRPGMLACADGVAWDPGSGAGIYEYRGGVWQKI